MRRATSPFRRAFSSSVHTCADLHWLARDAWRRRCAARASAGRRPADALSEPLEPRRLFAAGDLDPTFGNGGTRAYDFHPQFGPSTAAALVELPDGKILAAGTVRPGSGTPPLNVSDTDFIVVRYLANGLIDESFGTDGSVLIDFAGGDDSLNGMAVTSGGKIVLVGSTAEGSNLDVAVARLNANGTLDASFSDDGKRTISAGNAFDTAYDVAIDAAGKIVFAGATGSDFLVGRLNVNGTSDATFSGDGLQVTGFGGTELARAIVVLGNGDLVAAGGTSAEGGVMAFARYNPNGSLDTAFSGDGRRTVDFGGAGADLVNDLAVDAQGRLVGVGHTFVGGDQQFAVLRMSVGGVDDSSFSGDGKIAFGGNVAGSADVLRAVLIDGSQIIAAGGSAAPGSASIELFSLSDTGAVDIVSADELGGSVGRAGQRTEAVALARMNDGSYLMVTPPFTLAIQFAQGAARTFHTPDLNAGIPEVPIVGEGGEIIRDLAVLPDGSAVGVGSSLGRLLVVKFRPDGSLDTSFGTGGRTTIDIDPDPDAEDEFEFSAGGRQVEILPGGKILVGGTVNRPIGGSFDNDGFAFARLNANGSIDTTFSGDGVTSVEFTEVFLHKFVIDSNGKIVALGHYQAASGLPIARFNADGTLDTTFGGDGIVQINENFNDPLDLAAAPGGKLFVTASGDDMVARLNNDGSLDTSFSGDGVLSQEEFTVATGGGYGSDAFAVAPTADGGVIAAYTAGTVDADNVDFGVTRFTSTGAIDTTFGGNGTGRRTIDFGQYDEPTEILFDSAGRIIVAGTTGPDGSFNTPRDLAVARLTANGLIDNTFSGDGKFVTEFAPSSSRQQLFDLQPSTGDTFLLVGTVNDGDFNPQRLYARRYQGGGTSGGDPTTPSITIQSGVLVGRGTGGNDTISIRRTGGDDVIVTINGVTGTFDMDDFTGGVLLEGLGGNDTLTITDPITAGALTRKVTLDGGAGDDSLRGNSGDDVLRGGDGSDTLIGLAGADALAGQAGSDFLFGGLGLDFLDGGDNDDFLDSSDSAPGDSVQGGNGADTAKVDAGDTTANVETFV